MTSIRTTNKQITKRLTPQENTLKIKLHKFYKKNIRGNQAPTESLRIVYENHVKILIRQAIEEAYFTGTATLFDVIKGREFFISVTDIENIKDITEQMNNQFWITTGKLHRRENEFIMSLADGEMIKKQEFDTEAAYIMIASMMIHFTFNSSVVSKRLQLR